MKNIITITTDFGDQFAAAQLHAIIATYNFDGNIIENHSITPFSIEEGAFEIWQLSKFTPENTVHLGVVDPGVGSSRWGIIIKTKKGWYVGPDNGLLYPAATRDGITQVWKIKEESFGDISNTFHGRDVFVKAAVLLSQGKKPQDFECVQLDTNDVQKLSFRKGQIVHIDDYGDTKIWWPEKLSVGTKLVVQKKKKSLVLPVVRIYDDVPTAKPLALLGSQGTLEIAVNQRSAQKEFGFKVGEILNIQQEKGVNKNGKNN
jgi:S-adenosylmethionine hydrolase